MVSVRQWGIALLIWPLVGCNDRSKEMSQLLDQQALILQRLDALEASQARMLAGGVDARRRVDTATYHIAIDDSPSRGRINAPVTIVQFSDFECPYCARLVPELEQLVQKYPREVRVVYKQFPLPTHTASRAFAAASLAANEQRRFW